MSNPEKGKEAKKETRLKLKGHALHWPYPSGMYHIVNWVRYLRPDYCSWMKHRRRMIYTSMEWYYAGSAGLSPITFWIQN